MESSTLKYTDVITTTGAIITTVRENALRVQIYFTRNGWKQFGRLNRRLGARFIRAFMLKHELALYIAAHEVAGRHMDTECQELRFDDDVFLILQKSQGVWYITDVYGLEESDVSATERCYIPVYIWTQIKRGCSLLLTRVLIAWKRAFRFYADPKKEGSL